MMNLVTVVGEGPQWKVCFLHAEDLRQYFESLTLAIYASLIHIPIILMYIFKNLREEYAKFCQTG